MDLFVGTGGWSYLKTPFRDKLAAYSKQFNSVEVNSTFYIYPGLSLVKTWRKRVPENFQFTVKCHRDLTHKLLLEPIPESYRVFESMASVCKILSSQILVLQTPPNMPLDEEKVGRIEEFFSSATRKGLTLAWEVRGIKNKFPNTALKLMQDFNIIHVVDLMKSEPAYEHEVFYTRLFRREMGPREFSQLEKRLSQRVARRSHLTFHTLKMYEDAQNFIKYLSNSTVAN